MFNFKATTTCSKTPLKRKKLTLKPNELKDEEFMSPVKRRAKLSNDEQFNQSSSSSPLNLQRPSKIDQSFISPLKNWQGFLLSSPNSSTTSFNYLKTPSPSRRLKRPVVCKNIGNLLLVTPEKDSEEEDEEESDEEEEDQQEMINEEEESKEDEKQKKVNNNKICLKNRRSKKEKGNFVKLNMRHRRFAPSSKFQIKKKWRRKRKY